VGLSDAVTERDTTSNSKVQTAVRFEATDYDALVRRAAREDRSLASLVRRAVKLMLAEPHSDTR
jgi:hypothetical protein